jgi:sulfur-carrier protein adenylyltransferase/sulfurtransferase
VEVYDLHLTGQESSATVAASLKRLGECDVIMDSTSDPDIFNLMSYVTGKYSKPLFWMNVYARGIGCMVARSRLGLDTDPRTRRAAYHEAIADSPQHLVAGAEPYAAEGASGEPLAGSDAVVTVIAGHAARLVLGTMLRTEDLAYPHFMYLIGLARGWLFERPLHYIPISTEYLPEASGDEAGDLKEESEG